MSELSKPGIVGNTSKIGYSMFRARDVRANIIEMGFEKGVELSPTLLADEITGMRQSIIAMAEMQDQFINLLTSMGQINGAIAQKVDEMKRLENQFDESRGQGIIPPRNS